MLWSENNLIIFNKKQSKSISKNCPNILELQIRVLQ